MKHVTVVATLTLILLLILSTAPTQANEKYHMVRVPNPAPQTLRTMAELGLPLDDAKPIKGVGIELPLSESEIALLTGAGIPYTIVQDDLEKYYGEICRRNLERIPAPRDDDPVHMKYGSMGGFYTFQQMAADLDSMHLLYPNICAEKTILGYGWNNNPIYMVKISDNPGVNEDEPEGLFDGTHHAREPGSMACTIYAMWYLLENYGSDPEVTYLVNNRELYFVPIVNPDGYLYNQQQSPSGGGMWRKNRRNNGGSYGVDLNRNYTYQWGYDNIGSSGTASSETYRGPSAGSEPETQAMMTFTNAHDIKTALTVHSYAGVYLSAYGYANVAPEHPEVHNEYMAACTDENGYSYGYCYTIMYAVNGGTNDWQLHTHDIISLCMEVGSSGFWPSISEIMPNCRENLNAYLHLFWCAGGLVDLSSLEPQDGYLTPGATENLIATLFNQGWSTSEAATVELATSDPYVTLTTTTANIPALLKRTSGDNAANPFIVQVSAGCPIGHQVPFIVTIQQGSYTRVDTISMYVGTPNVYFEDHAETGIGNWTISSYWGLDSNNPHAGAYSFSDSPGSNYGNYRTCTMTLTQPLNLTGTTSLWLDFWARWDIEAAYDFCQVEVSTNGTTWTPVAGLYTNSGSGIGVQPNGEPGYDGTQASWVHEQMPLNAYAGASYLKVRFELKSDGGVVGDGFFVDDIKVMGFTGGATPNVTVTLSPYNPPIQIPASGGSFDYNISITNHEAAQQTFDFWTMIQLPDGRWFGPMLGPFNLTRPGGATIVRDRTQNLQGTAPAGNYVYEGRVGVYPGQIWNSSNFTLTKLATGDGVWVDNWDNWGEAFDAETRPSADLQPLGFSLYPSRPNPFNPTTAISFQLAANSLVSLKVYDTAGRLVATLVDGWREAGTHEVTFDAAGLPSGVYVYRLQAGDFSASQKLALLK